MVPDGVQRRASNKTDDAMNKAHALAQRFIVQLCRNRRRFHFVAVELHRSVASFCTEAVHMSVLPASRSDLSSHRLILRQWVGGL